MPVICFFYPRSNLVCSCCLLCYYCLLIIYPAVFHRGIFFVCSHGFITVSFYLFSHGNNSIILLMVPKKILYFFRVIKSYCSARAYSVVSLCACYRPFQHKPITALHIFQRG